MERKVLFDTTVLCGAFLNPGRGGLCMALLEFARIGVVEPVFTQEVVAEWGRLAKSGQLDGITWPAIFSAPRTPMTSRTAWSSGKRRSSRP